jgi:transposase
MLLLAEGVPIAHMATTVGRSRRCVDPWGRRFLAEGLAGLADKPGRGRQCVARPQEQAAEQDAGRVRVTDARVPGVRSGLETAGV